jgi:hypothetical protein
MSKRAHVLQEERRGRPCSVSSAALRPVSRKSRKVSRMVSAVLEDEEAEDGDDHKIDQIAGGGQHPQAESQGSVPKISS